MPAVMLDIWRPSECPIHGQVHAIWLDGHYGRWSAFHERTRYTCVRFDDAGKRHTHRFTPLLPSRDSVESCPSRSDDGDRALQEEPGASGGTLTSDGSTFTIPEIARLLISVGEGKPLRGCAHDLRNEARRRHCPPNSSRARPKLEATAGGLPAMPLAALSTRPIRPPKLAGSDPPKLAGGDPGPSQRDGYNYSARKVPRRVDASRSASTAMDYVDRYGPVVLESIAPERWPVYVALGSVSVPARGRLEAAGSFGVVSGGEVMIAADCEMPGRGYAFHARFGGGRDKDSWIDFLRSLSGAPTWIVAASEDGISQAVAELWPDTILFACENHLRDGLRAAARRDRIPERRPERGPVFDEIRGALRDAAHWQELVLMTAALLPSQSSHLRRWLDDHEALVRSQFLLKQRHRNAPTDGRAVEPAAAEIRAKLLTRAGLMRNLWRLNMRLALMAAHWSDLDREREYIANLERHFASPDGPARVPRKSARPDWASGRDFGGARSIDEFLAAAEARRRAAEEGRAAEERADRMRVSSRSPELDPRNAERTKIEALLPERPRTRAGQPAHDLAPRRRRIDRQRPERSTAARANGRD